MKKHKPDIKPYMVVFGILMVMTVLTVGVSYLNLPIVAAVVIGLAIALFKAGLVASVFMHLKSEHSLILVFLGITFIAFAILVIIPLTDFSATSDKLIHAEAGTVAEEDSH